MVRSEPAAFAVSVVEDDIERGIAKIQGSRTDVVLLGYTRISPDARTMVRRLRDMGSFPIIITANDNRIAAVRSLIQAGANSYVHRNLPPEQYEANLKSCLNGEFVVAVPNPGDWLRKVIFKRPPARKKR